MKKIITIIATATILAACQQADELDNAGTMPLNITADTRAIKQDADGYPISLSVSGKGYTYIANNDGTNDTFGPAGTTDDEKAANKIYIAPNTNTLPAYAWGTVNYKHDNGTPDNTTDDYDVDMPVLHANPTTPVTWNDGKPSIALALTPATTRIKLEITGVPFDTNAGDKATLHGIATPKTETGGDYAWTTTTMPPTLVNNDTDKKEVTLATDATYTPAIPGTIPTGAHMMTIKVGTKEYPIISTQPYNFLPGYQYKLTVTINASGKAEITNITIEDFASGDGIVIDKGNHYDDTKLRIIYNQATLEAFRDEVKTTSNINALQIANITLTLTDSWEPIAYYDGTYDGGGYTISGLKINAGSNDGPHGLFSAIYWGGTLTNIHLVNPIVKGGRVETGALVGLAGFGGTHVTRCSVTGGTVEGEASVGGLVGSSEGTIAACYTSGTIVSGEERIGGLVGWNDDTVAFCYTTATVSGTTTKNIGALVGKNNSNSGNGTIVSCYAISNIENLPLVGDPNTYDTASCALNTDLGNVHKYTDPVGPLRTGLNGKVETFTATNIWKAGDTPKLYWEQ